MAIREVLRNGEDISEDPTRAVAIKAANYALEAAAEARETKKAALLAQRAAERTERYVETAVTTIGGRVSKLDETIRQMADGVAARDGIIARELSELRESIDTALQRIARTSTGLEEVREKAPSRDDLSKFTRTVEHAVEVIEEAKSNPGVTIPSERVRKIVENELVVKEHAQLVEEKKTYKDAKVAIKVQVIAGIVVAVLLALAGIAWTVARAFSPPLSVPRPAPSLAP